MHPNRMLSVLLPAAILFAGFACVRSGKVDPVVQADSSYFAGNRFRPKPVSSGQTRVLVSMCDDSEPMDIQVSVYAFGPDTNGDEDLDLILNPGPVPISASEIELVQATYTDSGTRVSDYDSEKRFAIAVARNSVSVLMVDRADGTKRAGWVMTTGKVTDEVCLKTVSGRGGRLSCQVSKRQ